MNTSQLKINLLEEEKKENDTEITKLADKISANEYNIESSESQIEQYLAMNSEYADQIQVLKANNLLLDIMIEDYTIPNYASEEQVDED